MKRVRVDDVHTDAPIELSAERSHHVIRVCRLGIGDEVRLFDGAGNFRDAKVVAVSDRATVQAVGPVSDARPTVPVHLVLGLPKGPATDDAIRMATEAGVTQVHTVWAERTQGRPDRLQRWRRIAESAAAQCGRADVPQVHAPGRLSEILARLDGLTLWIATPGTARAEGVGGAVLIGPEGGWSPAEIALALKAGAQPMGLGDWVLRTATAAAIGVASLGPRS